MITMRGRDRTDHAANELHGAAALVWLVLDEPGTEEQLAARIADEGIATDWVEGLALLVSSGLVVRDPNNGDGR